MLIEKLKGLNLDRVLEIDEAVELSAVARSLESEYDALGIDTPGWLRQASDTLREEIAKRTQAAELAKLKTLEAQLESLKTAAEKRRDIERQIAEAQKRLGMAPAKTGR